MESDKKELDPLYNTTMSMLDSMVRTQKKRVEKYNEYVLDCHKYMERKKRASAGENPEDGSSPSKRSHSQTKRSAVDFIPPKSFIE